MIPANTTRLRISTSTAILLSAPFTNLVSVFKLVTYSAALENHTITPDSVYFDEDKFVYGGRTIQNWDRQGRGRVTAAEALAQSLNVTTAKIAVDLGKDAFYKAVRRFGFGQFTGVELAGEVSGIVKLPGQR